MNNKIITMFSVSSSNEWQFKRPLVDVECEAELTLDNKKCRCFGCDTTTSTTTASTAATTTKATAETTTITT